MKTGIRYHNPNENWGVWCKQSHVRLYSGIHLSSDLRDVHIKLNLHRPAAHSDQFSHIPPLKKSSYPNDINFHRFRGFCPNPRKSVPTKKLQLQGADGLVVQQWNRMPRVLGSNLATDDFYNFIQKCHQCEFVSETHCVMQP